MEAIKSGCLETEFLLTATTLPNPLVKTAPFHFWAYQDDYSETLRGLCGFGTALAAVLRL